MKAIDLGNDSINKTILRLAIPAMLGQLVNVLYGIVDRMYIGNIANIGDIALGGVGVSVPITTLLTSFSYLIGVGGAPLLAMNLGAKKEDEAKKILSNGFLAMLVLSIIIPIITLCCLSPLLEAFGATNENLEYAYEYMFIYLFGAPFAIMALGLNQFIICQGNSMAGMKTMLIGAIVNIILDPIFIFALNLNVAGAAIATVIAQFASFAYTVYILLRKTQVKINFGNYDLKLIGRIMIMGLSPFIILATDSVVNICLNASLKNYGGLDANMYLTVSTITTSFFQLVTMPLMGISSGTQAFISFNYGANNRDRLMHGERNILIFAIIFCAVCFGISFLIAKPFISIFTGDQRITEVTTSSIRIFMFGIIPLAFQYCFVDCLTALAKPKAAAFCSLFRKALIISTTFILPIFMGAMGCFYAEMISDCISSLVTAIFFVFAFPRIMHRRLLLNPIFKFKTSKE